ncbi:SagB/ThcOx family dehydrogenase [Streptomyces sp. NPDC059786]|uniref:SagB/ThcOx family dehydrogenase n=1 Tax=Streptomyces sp. NPDC059786 TaxID=3346946 RepID=UPI00365828F0
MRYKLNEFMRIRVEEPLVCDLLLERRSYRLPSSQCLPALAAIEKPVSKAEIAMSFAETLEVSEADAGQFVDRLIGAEILVAESYTHELMPQVRTWQKYGWTDALIYHCLTEAQTYTDVIGATHAESPTESLSRRLNESSMPSLWKKLPSRYLKLPEPCEYPKRDLGEVLLARRTHVPWSGQILTAAQISRVLLDANIPLRAQRMAAEKYREDPSVLIKNTYGDLESYLIVYDAAGIEPGIYHYDPRDHAIGLVHAGDFRNEVRSAFVGQKRAGAGSCSILLSAVWERHMFRYAGNLRGYRTLLMLIGQLAQRYLVAWTGLNYTTFPTPAHYAEQTDLLIGVARFEESGIYLITAG